MKLTIVDLQTMHHDGFYYYVESCKEFDNAAYNEAFKGYQHDFTESEIKAINAAARSLKEDEFLRVEPA